MKYLEFFKDKRIIALAVFAFIASALIIVFGGKAAVTWLSMAIGIFIGSFAYRLFKDWLDKTNADE